MLVKRHKASCQIQQIQRIHLPQDRDRPLLETTIQYGQRSIVVLSFHVIHPRSTQTSHYQVTEFDAVADWSRRQLQNQRQVVVIGDFNSTFCGLMIKRRSIGPNIGSDHLPLIVEITT